MKQTKERQFSWTRTLYLLVALVLVSLALILLSQGRHLEPLEKVASQVFTPIQQAASDVTSGVGNWIGSIGRGPALQEENDRLRAAYESQLAEIATLQELRRENEQLRETLKFQESRPELVGVVARNIGGDPSGQMKVLTIDQGSSKGLVAGMPVLSPSGILLGQVSAVKGERATVLLIIDVGSSVPVETQRTGVQGVLEGQWQKGGRLQVHRVARDADIVEGDRLVTSGIGDTFPQGLLVGQVATVRQSDVSMEKEAEVYPLVELNKLETMLVITNGKK